MLILARKAGQKIMIGDSIVITFIGVRGDHARIGIDAPRDVNVDREEIRDLPKLDRIKSEGGP